MNEFKFEELSVGLSDSFEHIFTDFDLDCYIQLCGDDNPLHASSLYAKDQGYKDRVIHGLLSSSLYSRLIGVYLPGKYALLQKISTSFVKPIYTQDMLKVSGEIMFISESTRTIDIKAKIQNLSNDTLSRATIKVGILDE